MCGICGRLEFDPGANVDPELLDRMMGTLHHRGPDGQGKYTSGPVGLCHTRLAIIDLSTGDQPMANEDKTVWVVYNGEVYNFPELREELSRKGHQFRSTTDTEVIVHLYEEYGVQSLARLRGMFAFALWDEKDRTLLLARDRVGIKPLYYANTGKALVFGSEIKALLTDPGMRCEVNPQSVDKFLTHLCLPGRETLWKGIFKLEPGAYLLVRDGKTQVEQYWDLHFQEGNDWKSLDEAADALYDLIRNTVKDHMISDVPVGFLLSGGVDSTVVLSCAAAAAGNRINTFTVGFENTQFEDERVYARLAAKRYGTHHHEITITAKEFWDFLPSLVLHMEEPVCDPPAVSLHYVSQLARRHVKVLLSGEGGDEAFGGYLTYRNFLFLEKIKAALRPHEVGLSALMSWAGRLSPFRKVAQYSPYAITDLPDYYYSRMASPFSYFNRNREALYTPDFYSRVDHEQSLDPIRALFRKVAGQPLLNQMQYVDTKTSLPEDLLIKADKMTMKNSLELRVPFLDHKLLEFAVSLPPSYRVNRFDTKRILKHAFRNDIPREIIRRKKAGFPLPLDSWMAGEFKEKVREVLFSRKCLDRGYFKRSAVEKILASGDQGSPLAKEIFSLLTLELLQVQFVDQRPAL
jgi:asparagine synthase (glutamine-hydrolysing)